MFNLVAPAQQRNHGVEDSIPATRVLMLNPRTQIHGDSFVIQSGICKPLSSRYMIRQTQQKNNSPASIPFLRLHGNIQYDFLYRSFTDTPFYQQDFRQHTIKTNYNFVFRQLIPVQLTLLCRNSNSPYFKDITDLTVRFSQQEYIKNLKENLLQQATAIVKKDHNILLSKLEKNYKQKLDQVQGLEFWLNSPARLQELVEESEKQVRQQAASSLPTMEKISGKIPMDKLPAIPDKETVKKAITAKLRHIASEKTDSVIAHLRQLEQEKKKHLTDSLQKIDLREQINEKKEELAKLKKELDSYKKQLNNAKKSLTDSLQQIKQEIARLKDAAELKNYVQRKKLETKQLPKSWSALAAIKSIGIGRSWVDYSELTVKNISLTGVNIELNPGKLYLAAAAGRINYRFRDFVVKPDERQPKQSLVLLRAGVGKKEGNNFIFTWYDGKKSLLNPYTDITSSNLQPQRVIGMAAETRININEHQYIIAEFAKSSFQTSGTANQSGSTLFQKVRNFRDHSNEAYSVKISSNWPKAGTKLTGYYRKMGEHFQSFNLQPVNAVQEAYQLKLQQQLWKKRVIVDAALRKNDFTNPYLVQDISSRNVFRSVQVSLRIPKYPIITVGYAPSSQLTLLDNQRIAENQYNTLNALMSYAYKAGNMSMVSNAMYLKFYNSSPDTGFIYYNASSLTFSQTVFAGHWQLQTGLTLTDQRDLKVTTLDQEATVRIKNRLSVSAGAKYSRVDNGQQLWGGNVGANAMVGKLGTIALKYDKAYLPGTQRNLLPVHTGSLGYYRSF